jgi:hypothetical protein
MMRKEEEEEEVADPFWGNQTDEVVISRINKSEAAVQTDS